MNALKKQVGGNHYNKLEIQPIEVIGQTELDYFSGNILKYLTRDKNNRKEDLQKALHYIDLRKECYQVSRDNLEVDCYFFLAGEKTLPFFLQFESGDIYLSVLEFTLLGLYKEAKELLQEFINKGEYSEV